MATKKTAPKASVKPSDAGRPAVKRLSKAAESKDSPATHPAPHVRNERIPFDVPTIYADQVMDVVYGIHTTKIVLGAETGSGTLRPVGVAILPTASLLVAAEGVVRTLTSTGIVEETRNRLNDVLNMMRAMAPGGTVNAPHANDKHDA